MTSSLDDLTAALMARPSRKAAAAAAPADPAAAPALTDAISNVVDGSQGSDSVTTTTTAAAVTVTAVAVAAPTAGSDGSIQVHTVKDAAITTRNAVVQHTGAYKPGVLFYELSKPETLGADTDCVLLSGNARMASNSAAVRQLLNLGAGEVSVAPKDVPAGATLYVRSKSHNRSLAVGQRYLIDDKNTLVVADRAVAVAAQATAVAVSATVQVTAAPVRGIKRKGADIVASAAPVAKVAATASTVTSTVVASAVDSKTAEPPKSIASFFSVKTAATATSVAVTTFNGVKLAPGWHAVDTVLVNISPEFAAASKIAAFDYDGCLAKTSLFQRGPDAWSMMFPSVPAKLKELHSKGYAIVILTNESPIGKCKNLDARERAIQQKVGRLEGFAKAVGIPFAILVATDKDKYRKPEGGMWELLVSKYLPGVTVDKAASFFVGDAAGRARDHGDGDLMFAKNVGLTFHTESDFFAH